jgi:predicted acyl esterase
MEVQRIGPEAADGHADQHRVRMRDGVRLATDHYVSVTTEPGPTVLIRMPYDKGSASAGMPLVARYMADRRYHVVVQDVRGKFRSEGETLSYVNEVADGYDTLQWIVDQEWSNGAVGMWGYSYFGFTQWAAAASSHPALRAISPGLTGTNLGALPVDQPGRTTRDVEMSLVRMYGCTDFHSNEAFSWAPDWSRRPYVETVENFFDAVGARSRTFDLLTPEPVPVRRFPTGHPFDKPPIPVLMTIHWWDNCAPWQWQDHRSLRERAGWAHNEYLYLDSGDHMRYYLTHGEKTVERSPAEQARLLPYMLDPTLEFFDVFLRNEGTADDIPRVRWNLAHTKGMRVADAWPPPGVRDQTLFLGATGGLTSTRPEERAVVEWTHDPDDLVPSRVRDPYAFLREYPDESAWASRADVLVFTALAVDADVDLVGSVSLTATVASSGPRMDVLVRLLDLAPDGTAHLIARGATHLVVATTPTEVDVPMDQVGYRLRRGHALQLHIASSDFPEYVPQPGTGEHPWFARDVVKNQQRIVAGGPDGARFSFQVLPDIGATPELQARCDGSSSRSTWG